MTKGLRNLLIAIVSIVLLVVIAAVVIPSFINMDSLRDRITSTLSKSLGRKVTIAKVELSLLSGGMVAQQVTVADDPAFSTQNFVEAQSLKISVDLLPLLLHRTVAIHGFTLIAPQIQLLRTAAGVWNYSSIGGSAGKAASSDAETKQTFPSVTIDKVSIEGGRVTVGSAASEAKATPNRVYDQVNLEVKDLGIANAFPFTASANLPAGGSLKFTGKAGPLNQQNTADTPFSGDIEIKHLDLVASGAVTAAEGISGTIDDLVLNADWNGTEMHVSKLNVDTPKLTIVETNTPPPAAAAVPATANASGAGGNTMLSELVVDEAEIKNGSVSLSTAGQTAPPAVYQQLDASIKNLGPTTVSPFTVSAQLPGGGGLKASGQVGPFNQRNDIATPLQAQIALTHVELGTAGVLPPDAGIAGTADMQAEVRSDGHTLNGTGKATVAGLRLAANGQPATQPLQMQFAVQENEQSKAGTIQNATVTFGPAVINLNGTYQTQGPTTTLNLKAIGNAVPIDALEAFLPAMGVRLPSGSRLQGGTLTTTLAVTGSSATPVIAGPLKVENTQLAGFNLGSKLQDLSQLTGGKIGGATGAGTTVRSLTMNVQESAGALRTDNIALDVVGLGTATGSGTVSAAGALDYNVVMRLTELFGSSGGASGGQQKTQTAQGGGGLLGNITGLIPGGASAVGGVVGGLVGGLLKSGIPVSIGGTTSDPSFKPNLGALMGGGDNRRQATPSAGNGTKPAQGNDLNKALGGLFGKH